MASTEHVARLRHLDSVHGIAFSPNGRCVAVADRGGMVSLWRIPSNAKAPPIQKLTEPIAAWAGHSGRAWSVAVSPEGDQVLSAGSDGSVKIWPTSRLPCWRDLDLHQKRDLGLLPKGWRWLAAVPARPMLVTAAGPQGLLLWDFSNVPSTTAEVVTADRPVIRESVPLPEPAVLDPGQWIVTDVSVDGRLVAAGSLRGDVAIWDLASRERQATWPLDPSHSIEGVAISPDAETLVARHGHTAWLVGTDSQKAIRRFEIENCHAVAFSPDGAWLAIGRGNDAVLAAPPQLSRQRVLRGHTNSVLAIAFSPDGRLLATGGSDRTVNLWEAASGELSFRLQGHRGRVVDIAFAHDSRSLVVADEVGTLRLWHVASGQELCILDEVPASYWCVDFLPDGHGLICGYGQHRIRLLDWGVLD
jgi:WD40 repeat protein